jgi:hypothetical protein
VAKPPTCIRMQQLLVCHVARGVENLHFSEVVEALINVSPFHFFVGFLIYLFSINRTVFNVVVWWIMASAAVYLVITFMPILRLDSPYYAPLSSLIFCISAGISYYVSLIPDRYVWLRDNVSTVSRFSVVKYLGKVSQGVETMAGESIPHWFCRCCCILTRWAAHCLCLRRWHGSYMGCRNRIGCIGPVY